MDTFNEFTNIARDIHNRHFEQKINKDQEIAERRVLDYFNSKLNLSWKTILREINKLNETNRNKYFEMLTTQQINTFATKYDKNMLILEASYEKIINKLKKLNWILSSALIIQSCIIIYLKWGLNV